MNRSSASSSAVEITSAKMGSPSGQNSGGDTKGGYKDFDVVMSIPFVIIHGIALIAPFFTAFSWKLVLLCLGSYYLRMFGVTAGFHRYFSHRTYRLNRFWQFCMAFLAQSSAQKGALWWAAHHRHHHRHSDEPIDIHSPSQDGFWWSHVGWILSTRYHATEWDQIKDFHEFPELRWLNKYHYVPATIFAVAMMAVGGWPALLWGFFVPTVLVWHGTFTINSLSHVFGTVRYVSNDTSKNNWFLALVTMGEGWHNNHHTYMTSTNQGFFWWEYDASYYVLKMLSWVGITKGLRKAPVELLESKRINSVAGAAVLAASSSGPVTPAAGGDSPLHLGNPVPMIDLAE